VDLYLFARYLPDKLDFLVVLPLSFLFAFAVAQFAAWLKSIRRLKTNYSRKIFHIFVFTVAFVIGLLAPVHRVAAYGAGSGLFIA